MGPCEVCSNSYKNIVFFDDDSGKGGGGGGGGRGRAPVTEDFYMGSSARRPQQVLSALQGFFRIGEEIFKKIRYAHNRRREKKKSVPIPILHEGMPPVGNRLKHDFSTIPMK